MKSIIVLTIGLNHEISLIKYSHGRLLDKMKYKTFFKKKYKCILKRVTGEVSQLNGWTFNNFSPLTLTCAKINLHLPPTRCFFLKTLTDAFSWRTQQQQQNSHIHLQLFWVWKCSHGSQLCKGSSQNSASNDKKTRAN